MTEDRPARERTIPCGPECDYERKRLVRKVRELEEDLRELRRHLYRLLSKLEAAGLAE